MKMWGSRLSIFFTTCRKARFLSTSTNETTPILTRGDLLKRGGDKSSGVPQIFDRTHKMLQRNAVARRSDREHFRKLRSEVAERLVERLEDTRMRFPIALDLGCGDGPVSEHIIGRGGVKVLYQCDSSPAMLSHCRTGRIGDIDAHCILADEEALPFAGGSLDLVVSNLCLHWINDVPGTLVQARRALRPDGLFLASMLGGDTLAELRQAFTIAEMERRGGVSPHVSPLAGVSDAGNLLGRAGFALPAVDVDTLTLYFPSAVEAMRCVQAMGESNAATGRVPETRPDLIAAAAAVYEALHRNEHGVPATFQVLYLSGWAPAATQPLPKKRGSAQVNLADLGSVVSVPDPA